MDALNDLCCASNIRLVRLPQRSSEHDGTVEKPPSDVAATASTRVDFGVPPRAALSAVSYLATVAVAVKW